MIENQLPAMPAAAPNNQMALTSLITGLIAWVLWGALLCFNYTIGLIFAMATMGISGICFGLAGFLPVIPWGAAVVTGHMGLSQIQRTNESGRGLAIAGLVMGYAGLGLTLCTLGAMVLSALGLATLYFLPIGTMTPTP